MIETMPVMRCASADIVAMHASLSAAASVARSANTACSSIRDAIEAIDWVRSRAAVASVVTDVDVSAARSAISSAAAAA